MHPKYLPLPIVDAGSLAWETNVPIDSTLTSYGLRVEEMARTSACAPLYQSFSAVSSPAALNAQVREVQCHPPRLLALRPRSRQRDSQQQACPGFRLHEAFLVRD